MDIVITAFKLTFVLILSTPILLLINTLYFQDNEKSKKDSDYLSCNLDKKASAKLEELCTETGLTKTKATEKDIERLYEEYKQTGRV